MSDPVSTEIAISMGTMLAGKLLGGQEQPRQQVLMQPAERPTPASLPPPPPVLQSAQTPPAFTHEQVGGITGQMAGQQAGMLPWLQNMITASQDNMDPTRKAALEASLARRGGIIGSQAGSQLGVYADVAGRRAGRDDEQNRYREALANLQNRYNTDLGNYQNKYNVDLANQQDQYRFQEALAGAEAGSQIPDPFTAGDFLGAALPAAGSIYSSYQKNKRYEDILRRMGNPPLGSGAGEGASAGNFLF